MAKRRRLPSPRVEIERLAWTDIALGEVGVPKGGPIRLCLGVGSGLSARAEDRPGRVWAIADRGPNFKVGAAVKRYGLRRLAPLREIDGAKIMPRTDIGPTICELSIVGERIELVRALPLRDEFGRAISGLPLPGGDGHVMEQAFDLSGAPLGADPSGADTEGIAALSDGSFWVGDEYAPSLLKVDAQGRVLARLIPKSSPLTSSAARYPIRRILPAIAARRRFNRGFEAIAASSDERSLYAIFQSGFAIPGRSPKEGRRLARIWRIDIADGNVLKHYVYPFDAPDTFVRDADQGGADGSDLKICDAVALSDESLMILERISHTAKIYRVDLADEHAAPRSHLRETQPLLEEMDDDAFARARVRPLTKRLIFSTDDAKEILPDLEGMARISENELLLVNDNDFGVEGAQTGFFRLKFDRSLDAL
jgi:hypothetical protein